MTRAYRPPKMPIAGFGRKIDQNAYLEDDSEVFLR
jgi:hypothetical protein